MVGWHHRLDGHEFEQAPGVGDGQGSLACCNAWSPKESDTTERLNWTRMKRSLGISNFLGDLSSFSFYCFPLFLSVDH